MKLYMVILALICAVGLAASDNGLDGKCSWGQSYWCQSLRTAKSCSALDHCKSTAWTNQILKKDDSDVCQFCKAIVDDVKRFIEEKRTEQEIAHFISGACSVIPKKNIADECQYIVEVAFDELLRLIANGMDPELICGLMRACSVGLEDTVQHSPLAGPSTVDKEISADNNNNKVVDQEIDHQKKLTPLVGVSDEPICTDCKKFFTDIRNMITGNKTEAEIEQMIDSAICALLGSLEDECKKLVHEFMPEIMQMLATLYNPEQICTSMGVCAVSDDKNSNKNLLLFTRVRNLELYKQAKQRSSPGACLLCESVMNELQSLDRNKDVQESVKSFIKTRFCGELGELKDNCVKAVDNYGQELFELIASELDPRTRCKSLGFCLNNNNNNLPDANNNKDVLPMTLIQDAEKMTAGKTQENKMADGKTQEKKMAAADPSPQCVLCEFIMRELREMIGQNATEQEIIDALDKVCDILPKTISDSCRSFIDLYGPAVLQLLLQELDPQQICTELNLCQQKMMSATTTEFPQALINVQLPGDSEECLVCETIVQYLEALLEQESTAEEIDSLMKKICDYLPQNLRKQCDQVVDKYGPMIINFISTLASPREICTFAKACAKIDMPSLIGGKEDIEVKDTHKNRLIGGEEEKEVKVPLLGANECTWGPSYWCLSVKNAAKCKALEHCKKVWQEGQ